jgi:hypothetical protein
VKASSEEMVAGEWRAMQEGWHNLIAPLRELVPDLPEVVQRLSQLETGLTEITGLQMGPTARSAADPSLTEEFRWLRERLAQASTDAEQLRKFRRNRDVAQMMEAAMAGLRFVIAAVAILRISLDIADRVNPRKMLRRSLHREAS